MRRWISRVLWGLTIPGAAIPAQAQIVMDMTPARIAEAIALGTSGEDGAYRMPGGVAVYFWTPFSRVTQLAWLASKRYEKIDPALMPGQTLAQEIRVFAEDAEDNEPDEMVVAIVLVPAGAKGREQAIQPTRTERTVGKDHDSGMIAYFYIEDWTEGAEVRVIQGNGDERKHRIRLKGVR